MIADRIRSIQTVSGGGGGFDPSQLSGLKLWLKADAGVTVDGSGNVSNWADQSGNGLDAVQTDAAKRPIFVSSYKNELPALKFTGTQSLKGTAQLLNSPCTAFLVVKYDSTTARMVAFNLGDGSSFGSLAFDWNTYFSSGSKQGVYSNNASFDTDAPADFLLHKRVITSTNLSGDTFASSLKHRDNGVQSSLTQKSGASAMGSQLASAVGYYLGTFGSLFPLSGYIAEVIVYNRILTTSETEQVESYISRYDGPDPYYEASSLILNMQGTPGGTTFTDESPNALTVTRNGDAVLVSDSTFGTVASFDGSGDWLIVPQSQDYAFRTGDFTVEFWFYTTNTSTRQDPISVYTASSGFGVALNFDNATDLMFYNGNIALINTVGGQWSGNVWNHVAISRSGTSLRMFLNGTQIGSAANSTDFTIASNLYIGAAGNATLPYNGRIGPTRITKGVARYTANFTPSLDLFPTVFYTNYTLPVSGAALWLDGADSSTLFTDAGVTPVTKSGDLVYQWSDKSGNNRHATQATSANRPTWVPPASGQNGFGALSFDGTSQWLLFPSLSLSSATIFIVYRNLDTTNGSVILGNGLSGSAGYPSYCYVSSTTRLNVNNKETGDTRTNGTQWDYSTFRYNGSTGVITCYSAGSAGTSITGASGNLVLASVGYYATSTYIMYGSIAEIIIYPTSLSDSDRTNIVNYIKAKWGF